MTTALFMLRCVQLGISIRDLDLLTIGVVNDMFLESSNDSCEYQEIAGQSDFDKAMSEPVLWAGFCGACATTPWKPVTDLMST